MLFGRWAPLALTLHIAGDDWVELQDARFAVLASWSSSLSWLHWMQMSSHVASPIIFPLSNPTSKAECTAENAYAWSNGRCIFASGSPFDPVVYNGKTFRPSQCNNMVRGAKPPHLDCLLSLVTVGVSREFFWSQFIFPGLGLGVLLAKAKVVSDDMFYASAKALASALTPEERESGMCFPAVSRIREISARVATAGA